MRTPSHAFATAVAILVATAAAAPAAGAATADVQIRDFSFRPAFTRIEPGDEVRWLQGGSITHTITSRAGAPEAFDTDLPPGQELRRAFPIAGRYAYHCTIHPEMRGVVQVGADTVAPKPTKLKARLGRTSARISFRLPEASKVSAALASKSKPRKILRRAKSRKLQDGSRSLTVRASGLEAGAYRVTVRAVDPEGNVGSAVVGLEITPAG